METTTMETTTMETTTMPQRFQIMYDSAYGIALADGLATTNAHTLARWLHSTGAMIARANWHLAPRWLQPRPDRLTCPSSRKTAGTVIEQRARDVARTAVLARYIALRESIGGAKWHENESKVRAHRRWRSSNSGRYDLPIRERLQLWTNVNYSTDRTECAIHHGTEWVSNGRRYPSHSRKTMLIDAPRCGAAHFAVKVGVQAGLRTILLYRATSDGVHRAVWFAPGRGNDGRLVEGFMAQCADGSWVHGDSETRVLATRKRRETLAARADRHTMRVVSFRALRLLGFCADGIKQAASDFGVSPDAKITPNEFRQLVAANPDVASTYQTYVARVLQLLAPTT